MIITENDKMKVFRGAAILAGISSGGGQAIRFRGKGGAKEACSGGKNKEECSAVVADHKEIAKEQNGIGLFWQGIQTFRAQKDF